MSVRERIISAFFPKTCPICERVLSGQNRICRECGKKLTWICEPKCQKCGKALPDTGLLYCRDCTAYAHYFNRGAAVFTYQGSIRKSLQRFKYQNTREYADFYGFAAAHRYHDVLKNWKIEAIIPVPLHKTKERRRGYNQAQAFAKALSRYTGIPVLEKLLVRIKKTVPQKESDHEMRFQNLKDAFTVRTKHIGNLKTVLLVDDIYTTGSTVDACSRTLKKAGIANVYVLCISAGQNTP